jgi:hypothetical protein
MKSVPINKLQLLAYGLPLLVVLSSISIAVSPLLKLYPELAMAITLDLTLVSPLLFLLLSRWSGLPKIRVVLIFIIGTVVATYILPLDNRYHLNLITTYIVPIAELLVITIVAFKVYHALKAIQLYKAPTEDILVTIKKSTIKLLGDNRFTRFLASELGIFHYGLFVWKLKRTSSLQFTNYKESGSIALIASFLMIVFIETITFHIVLTRWSEIVAWVFTILSIYTAFILFGHLKALIFRLSELTDNELILKNGIIADLTISLSEIDKIEVCSKEITSQDSVVANLGLARESKNHNVALYFKKPQTIQKVYGFTELCDILLFSIDNKKAFVEKVENAIQMANS